MANLGYIQVTRACNQECRFCSNPPTARCDPNLKELKKMVNNFIRLKYDGVILTGGEPTLSKELFNIIGYCSNKALPCRLVTNGQKLADYNYVEKLRDSGLSRIHLSIYSYRPGVQNYLTCNPDSFDNLVKALDNLASITSIYVDINAVINRYNAGHLNTTVEWICKRYPFISHFVWNNLDPLMNRASKNTDTIPKLIDFEVSLSKAMNYLTEYGKTFRIERVPLCYMAEYAHCSTETRKIVKNEERIVYFLDEKDFVRQYLPQHWHYDKAACCDFCSVNKICAGLYQMDKYYSSKELYPLFIDKEKIIEKILSDI